MGLCLIFLSLPSNFFISSYSYIIFDWESSMILFSTEAYGMLRFVFHVSVLDNLGIFPYLPNPALRTYFPWLLLCCAIFFPSVGFDVNDFYLEFWFILRILADAPQFFYLISNSFLFFSEPFEVHIVHSTHHYHFYFNFFKSKQKVIIQLNYLTMSWIKRNQCWTYH